MAEQKVSRTDRALNTSNKFLGIASFALGVADAFLSSGGEGRQQARKTAQEIRSDAGDENVDRLTRRRAHEVRLKNPGYFRNIGYNNEESVSFLNLKDSVAREFGYKIKPPKEAKVDPNDPSIKG